MQLGASTVNPSAVATVAPATSKLSHPPTRLLVPLVILFLCRCVPADAAEVAAPKWVKVCASNPEPVCTTFAQIEQAVVIQVFEPGQNPSIKKLRVIVTIENGSPSLKDTIRISVGSTRFAPMPFVFCNANFCAAEKDLSDGDMATLAGAGSFEIEAPGKSVKAPIGNFAAARAGTGMTEAEYRAEMERAIAEMQQKLRDRAEEINKRIRNGEAEQKDKDDRERINREQRDERRKRRE